MNPQFGKLSQQLGGFAHFYISKDQELMKKCNMRSGPSFCIYVKGKQVAKYSGSLYTSGNDTIVTGKLLPYLEIAKPLFAN